MSSEMKRGAIIPAMLLMAGCGLFGTRDPEDPVQPSANFVPPTEPSIVFSNMANAFADLSSLNYAKSFSDSATAGRAFAFEPTPQAGSKYGVFLSWTKQAEVQYFDNFKSQLQSNSVPSLVLSFISQSVSSDSAQFEASYQLTVPHTKPNVAQSAQGRAQFSLQKDNTQSWVIWRWVDLANQTGDFTWSDLKGEFGQ